MRSREHLPDRRTTPTTSAMWCTPALPPIDDSYVVGLRETPFLA